MIRLLIIAFALVVAYPYIPGSESEAFKGVSIFLGVIFSLGSSSFIANIIAGYTMTYRRAFKVGDRIQVNDISGDVVEMRLLVTHLRTVKNEEIVVPNSLILNSHVINYSTLVQSRGLILHTTVGIGSETSWRQVEAMLRLAAEHTPGLLKEPLPFVLQKSLGNFIEQRGIRFLLTGSSARKLRRGGVNLLGGRARTRYLHPLTCRELGDHFALAHAIERGYCRRFISRTTPKRTSMPTRAPICSRRSSRKGPRETYPPSAGSCRQPPSATRRWSTSQT